MKQDTARLPSPQAKAGRRTLRELRGVLTGAVVATLLVSSSIRAAGPDAAAPPVTPPLTEPARRWGGYPRNDYNESELRAFLERLRSNRNVSVHELTKSFAGRSVPYLRVGRQDGRAPLRALVTARQHPNEWRTSWVIEGLVDAVSGDAWATSHLELVVVPFTNYDGVVEKSGRSVRGVNFNRVWHEADQRLATIAPEIRAIRALVRARDDGRWKFGWDLHCPNLCGGGGCGTTHVAGWAHPAYDASARELVALINQHARSGQQSIVSTLARPQIEERFTGWLHTVEGVELDATIEFRENDVTNRQAHAYGVDLGAGLVAFLKTRLPVRQTAAAARATSSR